MIAGKNDTAWEKLFTKLHILEQIKDKGTFEISAKQIKEFREPRLMTKFDWKDSLPKLFRDNNLSILPNSRGTYLIGHFKAYQKLQTYDSNIMVAQLPEWVQTFQDFKITSESVALNIAQASGMIDTILKRQDGEPFAISTLTGRLKSGDINYRIQDTLNKKDHHDIHVENSQVEIDAGFENLDHLAVIEAKNRIPMDFLIRQLYYPYRLYQNLKTGKDILPIYFTPI